MPGLYLAFLLFSFAGVLLLAWRLLPGVVSLRLLRPVGVVLVVFLAFDWIGASRGWFASSLDWVVASYPPGIPPEEPILLAFLAVFSVVLLEAFRRVSGPRSEGDSAKNGAATDAMRAEPGAEGDHA